MCLYVCIYIYIYIYIYMCVYVCIYIYIYSIGTGKPNSLLTTINVHLRKMEHS